MIESKGRLGCGRYVVCWKKIVTVLCLLALLVLLPAAVALVCEPSLFERSTAFGIGSRVVYRQEGASTRPVPGACEILPAERGEFYYYSIINYLCVIEVFDDGRVVAITRNK